MLGWMVYIVVVTLILGGGAFVAERAAQMRKAPTRWLWAASMLASVIAPLIMSSVVAPPTPSNVGAATALSRQTLVPLSQTATHLLQPSAWLPASSGHFAKAADSRTVSVDVMVLCAWGATSAAIVLAIVFGSVRLHRRKRAWTLQLTQDAPTYVSDDVGPAVVGLLHPSIVLPRWLADAAPEMQALVLAHEQSHLDANDARLLAIAVLLLAAAPWNLPLWWQLRRLRFAIEVDCDARVLEAGHDVSRYGEALIMVGERQSGRLSVAAAMSESKSFLEQRIRKMLWKPKRFAWASATALAGLGFVLAASAAVVAPPPARLLGASETPAAPDAPAGEIQMKHYRNGDWNFALDVPAHWNAFPPVPSNSPFEVIRFASNEDGVQSLIVFRNPHDPAVTAADTVQSVQATLTSAGFSHFVTHETQIGSRPVLTLDFDQTRKDGKIWSCREYFILDGTLMYVLGFGTTDRAAMFDVFDRMAKTFTFDNLAS